MPTEVLLHNVRSSLARSKSGLTSSSVPIGLPLPNVQLALEKVRCVIHEESEWRGSAYQKKHVTYMCFLGWTTPDVACKNVDTRRWSDLGWWYGCGPVLKKQQIVEVHNNSVQSLQKANSLWQTETVEMDLDGAGELLVTWPQIHMPCSWCKSWKQPKQSWRPPNFDLTTCHEVQSRCFFCCMVVESDWPGFTVIYRHTHIYA